MRHSLIAVTPEHFEVLGEEYGKAIQGVIGERYTDEIHQSWHIVYTYITSHIYDSIVQYRKDFNYDRLVFEPPSQPPNNSIPAAVAVAAIENQNDEMNQINETPQQINNNDDNNNLHVIDQIIVPVTDTISPPLTQSHL